MVSGFGLLDASHTGKTVLESSKTFYVRVHPLQAKIYVVYFIPSVYSSLYRSYGSQNWLTKNG